MKSHIEIIDGQEVVVKVYEPRPPPKKVTVKTGTGKKSRMMKNKRIRRSNTK